MAGEVSKRPRLKKLPALTEAEAEVLGFEDLARQSRRYGPGAVENLARIAANGSSDAARVSASNSLLEWGFGRPKQRVDHTSSDQSMRPAPVIDLGALSSEERLILARAAFGKEEK
ncbi:MAG: hypothetical protein LBP61_02120 [Desulfovibrio sp.]|jgi:hypothetical protein|nr:hypothetical protein [Desulfovibrio sp.]